MNAQRSDQQPSLRSGSILLVTPQPFYEDRGTPIAVGHTVKALGELGYHVDVLAFPFGRTVQIPRVSTIRCGNPFGLQSVPIGFSWQKCLLDASLLRSFEKLLRRRHYDVVHAVEEAAYLAANVCGRAGKPYIYDMASSIPAELSQKSVFGSAPAQALLQGAERVVIDRAAHVICSMGLGDHVEARGTQTPYTEWRFPAILDAVDHKLLAEVRAELGIEVTDRVIVYSGNFARYQGMDLLFEAFHRALAARPDLMLVCVGASQRERDNCLHRLDERTRARVRIVTRRPRSEIPTYLAIADCLVSLRPVSKNLPLKVFEYMASGKPIVATRGPAHEPVLNHQRAILCDSNAESIASGIVRAFASRDQSDLIAGHAQTYAARQFGWRPFLKFVSNVYDNVLRPRAQQSLVRA